MIEGVRQVRDEEQDIFGDEITRLPDHVFEEKLQTFTTILKSPDVPKEIKDRLKKHLYWVEISYRNLLDPDKKELPDPTLELFIALKNKIKKLFSGNKKKDNLEEHK